MKVLCDDESRILTKARPRTRQHTGKRTCLTFSIVLAYHSDRIKGYSV